MFNFLNLLDMMEFERTTFIGLDTVTVPVLRGGKSNPFQGRIHKVMVGAQAMLFQRPAYAAMVRRRLSEEGKNPASFELSPRSWGVRVPDSPVVVHQGRQYLECIFARPGSVVYLLDKRQQIEAANIPGLELDKEEAEQGGLENKVIIRTLKDDSIRKIRMNGRFVLNLAYFHKPEPVSTFAISC